MTDQTTPPDPTTGPTPVAVPGTPAADVPPSPGTTPGSLPNEATVQEPAARSSEPDTASEATAPPPEAPTSRRRWVEVAVLVGAFVLVGGIGFAAGRTIDDGNERGIRSHRIDTGDQNGRIPGSEQLPGRGGFPGRGDGGGGFHQGPGSRDGSWQGRRGGLLPGDRLFPRGGMPGGGWQLPYQLPGPTLEPDATQAPGATQAPTASPAPSASAAP